MQPRPAQVVVPQRVLVTGRVCAIRKTEDAIGIAQEGIRKHASRKGRRVPPRTLKFARFVIDFTTFPAAQFPGPDVLEWCRPRWQVELVSKRFRSLAQPGHLPKQDDDSAKVWLCEKQLGTPLVEKLIGHATAVSPWDPACRHRRPHGARRDLKFQVHQVTRAIDPRFLLSRLIAEKNEISEELANPPRLRLAQLGSYFN